MGVSAAKAQVRGQTPPKQPVGAVAEQRVEGMPAAPMPAAPTPRLPPADWTRGVGDGVKFTEDMHGSVSGVGKSKAAEILGRGAGLTFRVTIVTDDVDAMVKDASHTARLTGTVNCPK